MPRLFTERGRNIGVDYPVLENMILGRKNTCSIIIDDGKTSREHTRIFQENGVYYVEDLGSSNGTCLNGVKITKSPLVFGDRIKIGDTVLVFAADPEQDIKGRIIGGFEILEKLGARDIGVVYKARQITLDRIVALKVLDKELAEDTSFVERFIREARTAGTLRHPNIIQVFDVGCSDSYHFISMEYVDSKPLRDVIGTEQLSIEETIRIIKECASALGFAHERGIAHQDVTPSNIILTAEKVVKIADMGTAGLLVKSPTSRDIESLHYISPEEALGKPVGPFSDMYSLGLCFYQMLTGSPPFVGESAVELIKQRVIKTLPHPSEINPEVSNSLDKIVLKMCARNPEDRYLNMKAVIDNLDKITLSKRPVAAKHAPASHRAPRAAPAVVKSARDAVVFRDTDEPQPKITPPQRKRVKKSPVRSAVAFILFIVFLIIVFAVSSFASRLYFEITDKEENTKNVESVPVK
ncbi:MAG: protein kinase [Planctomycetota bacterium]